MKRIFVGAVVAAALAIGFAIFVWMDTTELEAAPSRAAFPGLVVGTTTLAELRAALVDAGATCEREEGWVVCRKISMATLDVTRDVPGGATTDLMLKADGDAAPVERAILTRRYGDADVAGRDGRAALAALQRRFGSPQQAPAQRPGWFLREWGFTDLGVRLLVSTSDAPFVQEDLEVR